MLTLYSFCQTRVSKILCRIKCEMHNSRWYRDHEWRRKLTCSKFCDIYRSLEQNITAEWTLGMCLTTLEHTTKGVSIFCYVLPNSRSCNLPDKWWHDRRDFRMLSHILLILNPCLYLQKYTILIRKTETCSLCISTLGAHRSKKKRLYFYALLTMVYIYKYTLWDNIIFYNTWKVRGNFNVDLTIWLVL